MLRPTLGPVVALSLSGCGSEHVWVSIPWAASDFAVVQLDREDGASSTFLIPPGGAGIETEISRDGSSHVTAWTFAAERADEFDPEACAFSPEDRDPLPTPDGRWQLHPDRAWRFEDAPDAPIGVRMTCPSLCERLQPLGLYLAPFTSTIQDAVFAGDGTVVVVSEAGEVARLVGQELVLEASPEGFAAGVVDMKGDNNGGFFVLLRETLVHLSPGFEVLVSKSLQTGASGVSVAKDGHLAVMESTKRRVTFLSPTMTATRSEEAPRVTKIDRFALVREGLLFGVDEGCEESGCTQHIAQLTSSGWAFGSEEVLGSPQGVSSDGETAVAVTTQETWYWERGSWENLGPIGIPHAKSVSMGSGDYFFTGDRGKVAFLSDRRFCTTGLPPSFSLDLDHPDVSLDGHRLVVPAQANNADYDSIVLFSLD